MRAVCETCGAAQPLDWKAGDLCASCGTAVRRDVRCFWCAKWTPFAKFCRSCGAEVVEETLYGAARMLKDAGTDRFTVPKRLRELDPEQVENFTRIYQRHAAAAARHVDEVRFLEGCLLDRVWSAATEDDLVGQLPWDEGTLAAMAGPPLRAGAGLARAAEIGRTSPLPLSRSLATLARVRLDDWTAVEEARSLLSSGDPLLENEAALVLSGWRVRYGHGVPDDPGRLSELLRRSASRTAAAVRLGLLTADAGEVPPDAVGHPDPETAFTAALARGDVDRLVTALTGETLERIAAGSRLVDLEAYAPLDRPLRDGPLEVQRRLVEALAARRRPAPPLAEALVEIVEKSSDAVVREGASRVLCRQLRPDLALRIARAAEGSRSIFQLLLLPAAGLPDETVAELLSWMVESGTFRSSQFGLEGVAERGAVPDDLVPRLFARAGDEMRRELLGLAEVQLRSRGDEVLHRFVMNVVFGPYPVTTRSAAWWVLRRWYLRTDPRGEGPFRLTPESIVRFFGTVDLFVPLLAGLLADPEALADPTLRDLLGSLFRAVEKEGAAALAAAKGPERLVRALLGALRADAWPSPGEGTVRLLGLIGNDSRWKADVISGLLALGRAGNHHWETALRSLQPAER